jgi:hypothetical protein
MTKSKTHSNTFRSEREDRDLSPEIWDRNVTRRRKTQGEIYYENMKSDTSTKINSNMSSVFMKPATFDGTGSWIDYKAHFEACSEINNWSYKQKGLYLTVSLRGNAQGIFGNLGNSSSYTELVNALQERFAPPNQTELYRVQLRERRQKATETLSKMAQDIRRLTNLAYPSAPGDVKETLAKEQFIDSLFNSDMRLRIKQARPLNLNDAVRHAVELESFYRAERKHFEKQGSYRSSNSNEAQNNMKYNSVIEKLIRSVEELNKRFDSFQEEISKDYVCTEEEKFRYRNQRNTFNNKDSTRTYSTDTRDCFNCGDKGHIQYTCPNRKQNFENTDRSSGIKFRQYGNDNDSEVQDYVFTITSGYQNTDNFCEILKCAQEEDENIQLIKTWIGNGYRPEYQEILNKNFFLKSLWSQWSKLEIRDNLLVRRWETLGSRVVYWQAIVPYELRHIVLAKNHKSLKHLGIRKTLNNIRQRFYWPGLQNDVRCYVYPCETCQKTKEVIKTKKIQCNICGTTFKKNSYLKIHTRKYHGKVTVSERKTRGIVCDEIENRMSSSSCNINTDIRTFMNNVNRTLRTYF